MWREFVAHVRNLMSANPHNDLIATPGERAEIEQNLIQIEGDLPPWTGDVHGSFNYMNHIISRFFY